MSSRPDELARACRHAQLIGAMLVLSLVTYAFVAETIRTQQAPFIGFVPAAPIGAFRVVLAGMAAVNLLVARIIPRNIRARRAAGPAAQRLLTASVVALAMCEAIAIYGFVLFLLGGRRTDFYAFAALSLLGFAWHFPRLSQWEAWAHQA